MKPGGTRWDETGYSVDAWNPFQTRLKLVLLCSVDRALVCSSYIRMTWNILKKQQGIPIPKQPSLPIWAAFSELEEIRNFIPKYLRTVTSTMTATKLTRNGIFWSLGMVSPLVVPPNLISSNNKRMWSKNPQKLSTCVTTLGEENLEQI